jgi:arginyl-tRNA synthetase
MEKRDLGAPHSAVSLAGRAHQHQSQQGRAHRPLRNAILGDTFVRLLRAAGQKVDVQNYIDNTGVQVADVVVGFLHLEGKSVAGPRCAGCSKELKRKGERIDRLLLLGSLCAHLAVVRAGNSEEEKAARKKLRYATLHEIEQGGNETAEDCRADLDRGAAPPS